MKTNILVIFAIILAAFFLLLYGYFIESNRLVVKEQDLKLNNWNKQLDGFRVLIISDLHIGTKRVGMENLQRIVELSNQQGADIIALLGDFDAESITYSSITDEFIISTLDKLKAPNGVFAILGNHDYKPVNVVKNILVNSQIHLLENKCQNTFYNNQEINICGTGDLWHKNVDFAEIDNRNAYPTVLLTHNPDVFPLASESVALTLSGHTHGGEIIVPLLGSPFVPSKYCQRYHKGRIVENGKTLFVTSGIASLSRIRLFNPPEIVILNLYSAGEEGVKDTLRKHGLSDLFFIRNKRKYK